MSDPAPDVRPPVTPSTRPDPMPASGIRARTAETPALPLPAATPRSVRAPAPARSHVEMILHTITACVAMGIFGLLHFFKAGFPAWPLFVTAGVAIGLVTPALALQALTVWARGQGAVAPPDVRLPPPGTMIALGMLGAAARLVLHRGAVMVLLLGLGATCVHGCASPTGIMLRGVNHLWCAVTSAVDPPPKGGLLNVLGDGGTDTDAGATDAP